MIINNLGFDFGRKGGGGDCGDCENILTYVENIGNLTVTADEISGWDTSGVTDMSGMFSYCTSSVSLDLSNWNISNVYNMREMFYQSSVQSLDLSGWDISNVCDMRKMFFRCTSLTSLDLSGWDVRKSIINEPSSSDSTIVSFFRDCRKLENINASGWKLEKSQLNYLFYNCSALKSLNLSNWDISNAIMMNFTFSGCTSLASLDLSSFDSTNILTAVFPFDKCSSLKKLTLSSKFFNSTSLATYDFSGASNWTDADSLATLVEALPTITTAKAIKLSTNTKAALTDEQKTAITTKGWTIS